MLAPLLSKSIKFDRSGFILGILKLIAISGNPVSLLHSSFTYTFLALSISELSLKNYLCSSPHFPWS